MKKFVLASIASLSIAPATYAQSVDLAVVRAACLVGGGSCLSAVQTFLASPEYVALPAVDRVAQIGALAAEVRSVGLEAEVTAVDTDVVAALTVLSSEAVDEGDTTLSTSIVTASAQVSSGETTETAEPVAFSSN